MNDLIIIGGPSGVGKTTVALCLAHKLSGYSILSQDNFCSDRSHLLADRDFFQLNHELPEIIDNGLAANAISDLRMGAVTTIPVYTHAELRRSGSKAVRPGNIIYEGLHSLYDHELVASSILSVFLNAPEDVVRARRRARDINERGVDPSRYDEYFRNFVWPGFQKYVLPTMGRADLVLEGQKDADELADLIIGNIPK